MIKVAIYCRLSDEDRNKLKREDDSESIQNQKSLLTRHCFEQGWDIYKIYSDDDYSGLDKDRPEFNEMLMDAEAKKFNIILCKSQSRFTRDMELVEKYLHNLFILWGIRFIGLTDNADTLNRGNKKQRQIMGLTNEWYCEDVSDNIRSIFNMKRSAGLFIGSFASYGYMKDPDNKNRLIIDEVAAAVVRSIYSWYLEGYGTQHIAYMLNERGIPNPTRYKQKAGLNFKNSNANNEFGLWNKTTLKRILKNEMYSGCMVQGKRRKVSYKSKKIISTQKDEWIKVEGTHEPIIDKVQFEEVQRRINLKQRSTGEGQAHIFATKVRCADCGSTMNKVTAYRGIERLYSYLRCKVYAASADKGLCSSHTIRLDFLSDIVAEKMREYMNSILDENSAAHQLQAEAETDSRVRVLQNEKTGIGKQLQQNSQALKGLYLDKINGSITYEQFVELNKSFSAEKEILSLRKANIEKQIEELRDKLRNLDKWVEIARRHKNFEELTPYLVNGFIECIEVGEKNKETGEQRVRIKWLF